jgi:hypothetical protein
LRFTKPACDAKSAPTGPGKYGSGRGRRPTTPLD